MAKTSNDRFSYGLVIMIFGLIFLLNKTGILNLIPYGERLMTAGSFFLIGGIIFLLTKSEKKIGIILTAIGLLMNADFFFGWVNGYSNLFIPIILIIIGLVMVLTAKR